MIDEGGLWGATQSRGKKPIKPLEEKRKLVPAFLQVKGLVKPHIDSFNHFINIGIKKSSTHEKKSRTVVPTKRGKYYLRHNSMTDDIPIANIFKAMETVSDQEIMQLIGTDIDIQNQFTPFFTRSFSTHNLHTA